MGEYAGRGKLPETNAAGIKQLLAGFGLEPGQLGSIPAGPDPFTRDKAGVRKVVKFRCDPGFSF